MSWSRRIRVTALSFVLLVCAAYLALLAYGAYQLAEAQAVIASLESVRLGIPLTDQPGATHFRERHCEEAACFAEDDVSNLPGGVHFWKRRSSDIPSILPWKWWTVTAAIRLDSAGNAVEKWALIDDGRYFQDPTIRLFIGSDQTVFDPCRHAEQIRHPGYRPRRAMRTGALWLDLASDADEKWVRRAFELRLNCLGTYKGCKDPGDMAPEAWQDQIDDLKLQDSDFANQARVADRCRE
jgi:hypothetical protein